MDKRHFAKHVKLPLRRKWFGGFVALVTLVGLSKTFLTIVLFMNRVAESVFSGSTPRHESIQTYGHVVIITDPRHIDFGSKFACRRPNMRSYI